MKKSIFLLILATSVLLWNCHSVPQPVKYNVQAKVPVSEANEAIIYTLDKKLNRVPIDTVKVQDSLLVYESLKQNPHLAIIAVDKIQIPLIIGDGDIIMEVDPGNIFKSKINTATTSGLTKKFYEHERYAQIDKKKGMEISMKYRRARDIKEQDSIKKVYDQWRKNAKDYQYKFIQDNKDYVGLIIIQSLLSGQDADFQKIKNAFNTYPEAVRTTNLGKFINTVILTKGATEIGGQAPNFVGTTPDGKKLSLSQAMGKVTIIDFWASWCRPCRAENPYVVEIYNKYHDQGLNIIGVSLDKNKQSWLNAIKDDGLKWQHVSSLKYWQEPIAKTYGVFSIPQTFILDAKGVIRAKNLRREELEAKIKELINE